MFIWLNYPATIAVVFATVMLLLTDPVAAQTDWLKRGKEMLGTATKSPATTNNTDQISAGLKEALRVGSKSVIDQLGQVDGFNADPAIHIPLPKSFTTVQSTLKPLGMSYLLDDLELKLNRAAEQASSKAKELFAFFFSTITI